MKKTMIYGELGGVIIGRNGDSEGTEARFGRIALRTRYDH
jgi:hypothetical protein